MKLDSIAQIEWDFGDENADWKWCMENATFSHREACEFILYIGDAALESVLCQGLRVTFLQANGTSYWEMFSTKMREDGCSAEFIAAYLEAKDAGAIFALFWS